MILTFKLEIQNQRMELHRNWSQNGDNNCSISMDITATDVTFRIHGWHCLLFI